MTTLASNVQLSMAATSYSGWFDLRALSYVTLQCSANGLASPVGVVTVEYSNDVGTVESERAKGVAPAASVAARVDVSAALVVLGTSFATGFNGNGVKSGFANLEPVGIPNYVRVVYTRTSGGAGDFLLVNVTGR